MPSSGVVASPPSKPSKPERSVRPVHPAPSAAWLFSAAQNGGQNLRPHRPQRSRHQFPRCCCGRSRSSTSVYRPPQASKSVARTVRAVRTVAPRHLLAH
jgi:hypothetical protein